MQQKYQSERLGIEPIPKLLRNLSIPAMVGMFVMALYNIVDTIFISYAMGITAVAGLMISFPVLMIIMAISVAMGIGGASVISRRLGAKRENEANQVFGNIVTMIIIVSIIGIIGAFTILEPLLILFGATPDILGYSYDYMFPILLGTFLFSFGFATNSIVRSEGNARFSMNIMIISSVLNIILDAVFIFGLKMGISGAAYATLLSQGVVTVLLLRYFLTGRSSLTLSIADLKPKFAIIKEVFSVGLPGFMQQAAGGIMVISINAMLLRFGSEFHVGLFGIVQRISMFMLMPLVGIMQGMQPIVGYNFGANNFSRLKETVWLGLKSSTILSTGIFVVMMIFPKYFMILFSSDPEVIKAGSDAIRILFATAFFIGVPVVCGGIFQALGKVKESLILSMSRQILFLIPLVLTLPHLFGVNGVWLAFPIADGLSFALAAVLLYRNRKIILREDEIVEPLPYQEVVTSSAQ
ncbi:MATE family efflux transporter [Anaerobacillus isosaccharinicus]|uniref:Multidrug export protein MepA n=1 Tax=Anaerobacillus isosaccharinicus TaxID=1532552 RepID=A0A1S2M3D2_9BACI|nr:MATE family efflux transporter [Anaerobacillus isosaccharinicus]MBA5588221.1 MATE family efflux transporter [Anaerobacillus isosaccharinicus]QOY38331.1 MATE family efflux transporter [Anaerobacillus isosaccharinicus]